MMKTGPLLTVLVFSFGLPIDHAQQSHAQTFFADTFDDGDHLDGMPAVWSPGGDPPSGDRSVVQEWLVHTPENGESMSTYADECLGDDQCYFDDVSLRTSFVVDGDPSFVTLFARSLSSPTNATLFGGIDSSGRATMARNVGGESGNTTFYPRVVTGLDPTDELNLQFDLLGNEMSLWIWPRFTARPILPWATEVIPDSYPHSTGTVGFFFSPGQSTNVAFDYFLATEIGSGDFNDDGFWDCDDINALSQAIANGSTDIAFDMNGDDAITRADITDAGTGWLAVAGANNPAQTGGNPFLDADANLDGVVDGLDFIVWNNHRFTASGDWCGGDFDANGVVDGSDFIVWNGNKFTSSNVAAVPEPGAGGLLLATVLMWLWRRLGKR